MSMFGLCCVMVDVRQKKIKNDLPVQWLSYSCFDNNKKDHRKKERAHSILWSGWTHKRCLCAQPSILHFQMRRHRDGWGMELDAGLWETFLVPHWSMPIKRTWVGLTCLTSSAADDGGGGCTHTHTHTHTLVCHCSIKSTFFENFHQPSLQRQMRHFKDLP